MALKNEIFIRNLTNRKTFENSFYYVKRYELNREEFECKFIWNLI